MLYLDTSSLLKSFFSEPESDAVDAALARETAVVITPITELESAVQLRGRWLGGRLTNAKYQRSLEQFEGLRSRAPFVFRNVTGSIFLNAIRQDRAAGDIHCRSLDRLHLAAMEELEITRLMTHDGRQADAARAAGFFVMSPGRARRFNRVRPRIARPLPPHSQVPLGSQLEVARWKLQVERRRPTAARGSTSDVQRSTSNFQGLPPGQPAPLSLTSIQPPAGRSNG